MIGMRTILEVADNSGARRLQCILPRGGDLGLRAGLGDVITAAVKEAAPDSAMPSTCALSNCTGMPNAIALMIVALCAASMPSMSKVGSASA